jgi:hypothetical protein
MADKISTEWIDVTLKQSVTPVRDNLYSLRGLALIS